MDYNELLVSKVSWRRVAAFLNYPDRNAVSAVEDEFCEWCRTLRFDTRTLSAEKAQLKMLAFADYLREKCGAVDFVKCPKDESTDSPAGFNSLLRIVLMETLDWVPPVFFRHGCADYSLLSDGPSRNHTMNLILSSLFDGMGFDSDFTSPDICRTRLYPFLKKGHWFGKYEETPAANLGLSFLANGCCDILTAEASKAFTDGDAARGLSNLMAHLFGTWSWMSTESPYDEWTARLAMFLLSLASFVRGVEWRNTDFEHFALACLYLRFYRSGPDGLLGRGSLSKKWCGTTLEERESEAAAMRRWIVEHHNKNA